MIAFLVRIFYEETKCTLGRLFLRKLRSMRLGIFEFSVSIFMSVEMTLSI